MALANSLFNITFESCELLTILIKIFMELSKFVLTANTRVCHAKNKLGAKE